jgi:hypothetical protein
VRPGHKQLSELERRPLWRRRLTLIGAVLLWLSGFAFWIASLSSNFSAGFASPWPHICIAGWASADGRIFVMFSSLIDTGLVVFAKDTGWGTFMFRLIIWERGGFGAIQAPWWVVLTIGALLPALAWRDLRRGKRMTAQIGKVCLHCGYDLRASRDRCPECGALAPLRETEHGSTATLDPHPNPLPSRERFSSRS